MSREIKFRIWDDTPIKDGFKGIMISHEYAIKSSYLIDALSGKYPIMQSTGLKDINGVDVYEGDILKTKNGICSVIWFDAAFALKSPGYEAIDFEHSSVYELSEVIGNIHEHHELLTQHKK